MVFICFLLVSIKLKLHSDKNSVFLVFSCSFRRSRTVISGETWLRQGSPGFLLNTSASDLTRRRWPNEHGSEHFNKRHISFVAAIRLQQRRLAPNLKIRGENNHIFCGALPKICPEITTFPVGAAAQSHQCCAGPKTASRI